MRNKKGYSKTALTLTFVIGLLGVFLAFQVGMSQYNLLKFAYKYTGWAGVIEFLAILQIAIAMITGILVASAVNIHGKDITPSQKNDLRLWVIWAVLPGLGLLVPYFFVITMILRYGVKVATYFIRAFNTLFDGAKVE